MRQLLKKMDMFKLPVIFYFNRRNRKKNNRKQQTRMFGSIYGFTLTLIIGIIMTVFASFLINESYSGESNTYGYKVKDNDFKG